MVVGLCRTGAGLRVIGLLPADGSGTMLLMLVLLSVAADSEPAEPLRMRPRRRWRLELRLIGMRLDRRAAWDERTELAARVENSDSSSEVKSSS